MFEEELEEEIKYPLCHTWARIANMFMFGVHFLLLVAFGVFGIFPMVAFNVFSLFIYMGILPRLEKRPRLYIAILYIEVLTHMICAIWTSGWDSGFQLYAFFLVPFAFYADYILIEDGAPTVQPLIPSFVATVTYIVCWFLFSFQELSQNLIPTKQASVVFILNSIGLLSALIYVTYVFLARIIDNARKMVRTAEYDELTGLANRHQIDKLLKMHDIGGPTGPQNYGVAIFDIDNFKKVNDQFGHLAGDRVLYDIAVILRSVETSGTYAFRWGGEEFMILALEDEATEKLRDVCERVRKLVASNTTVYELHRIGVTISAGYTKADAVSEEFSAVVERADTCLYYAKGHGKNQVITKEDMK